MKLHLEFDTMNRVLLGRLCGPLTDRSVAEIADAVRSVQPQRMRAPSLPTCRRSLNFAY